MKSTNMTQSNDLDDPTELTAIVVSNFKAIGEEVRVPLSRLNVISGSNSSGKSSIYQAVMVLAQSDLNTTGAIPDGHLPRLRLNGPLVSLSMGVDVVIPEPERRTLIGLEWSDGAAARYEFCDPEYSNAKELGPLDLRLVGMQLSVRKGEALHSLVMRLENDIWKIDATSALAFMEAAIVPAIFDLLKHKVAEAPRFLKESVAFQVPKDAVTFFGRALFGFSVGIEGVLSTIKSEFRDLIPQDELIHQLAERGVVSDSYLLGYAHFMDWGRRVPTPEQTVYLPPFRDFPSQIYDVLVGIPDWVQNYVDRREEVLLCDVSWNGEPEYAATQKAIDNWVCGHFKLGDHFSIEEIIPRIIYRPCLERAGRMISLANVGFGTSQIIPVIVQLVLGSSTALYVIDEPETHLHPQMQSLLAEFFIKMAMLGRRMIVETHSDHLIRKLISFALRYDSLKSSLSLRWVQQGTVSEIVFDDLGFFVNAPEGFIDEYESMVDEFSDLRLRKIEKDQ